MAGGMVQRVVRLLWLLVGAGVAFGPTLAGGFTFDDFALLSDPAITSPGGWWEVWLPSQTRPLTWFTFWLCYHIFGEQPAGWHVFNLGLHLAAIWLLFRVLSRTLPEDAAWLGAAIFALHPIQTEPVAYVFARGTLLMTVFCLLSLDAWIRGRHWIAAAWFLPALLSKEECVAFPLFLVLLHLSLSRNLKERAPIAVMLALSLAAGLRVIWATAVTQGAGAGFGAPVSWQSYFLTQGVVWWRYIRLLLIPWGFSIDPDVSIVTDWRGWLGWLGILFLLAGCLRRFEKAREGFWLAGAAVLLAPSSSVLPAADLEADRRLYLPMCALGAAAGSWTRRFPAHARMAGVAVLLLLCTVQSLDWRSPEAVWQHAVDLAPAKIRPRVQLARSVSPERAVAQLEQARKIAPDDALVASEMGRAYLSAGDTPRALAEFGRALALNPSDAKALNNRGVALLAMGQREAAQADFEQALIRDPCLFDAWLNLLRLGLKRTPEPLCRFTSAQRNALQGE